MEARSGCDADALAGRAAEITGKPQRIEPILTEDLGEEARDLVNRVGASVGAAVGASRDGALTCYFRTMAKHPEIFRRQLEMGVASSRADCPRASGNWPCCASPGCCARRTSEASTS
jgi:hypothetical protein